MLIRNQRNHWLPARDTIETPKRREYHTLRSQRHKKHRAHINIDKEIHSGRVHRTKKTSQAELGLCNQIILSSQ